MKKRVKRIDQKSIILLKYLIRRISKIKQKQYAAWVKRQYITLKCQIRQRTGFGKSPHSYFQADFFRIWIQLCMWRKLSEDCIADIVVFYFDGFVCQSKITCNFTIWIITKQICNWQFFSGKFNCVYVKKISISWFFRQKKPEIPFRVWFQAFGKYTSIHSWSVHEMKDNHTLSDIVRCSTRTATKSVFAGVISYNKKHPERKPQNRSRQHSRTLSGGRKKIHENVIEIWMW